MALAALALAGVIEAQAPQVPPAQSPGPRENFYAAANRVDLAAPIDGDAVVAGRIINLSQPVSGDVLAAGWLVTLSAPASDDVRIAGGDVSILAPIEGDLTAAGGDLTVGPQVRVRGRAWLSGGTVRADGTFDRELQIYGDTVTVGGEVREPLIVVAQSLTILPSARLLARVSYKGPAEARVEPGATLTVPIAYERIASGEARRQQLPGAGSAVLFTLHLTLAGLVFFFLVPRISSGAATTLRAEPGRSVLAGFVLLVTVPVAALLLVVSVLGLPVGLALVALYFVALLLGLLTTAYALGEFESRLLKRPPVVARSQRALALVAGVVTLALLRTVPFVGGWIVFLAVLFGLGSLALWIYRVWMTPAAPTSATVAA
jgi:cytoskeletal protein CcmA (bactofilin family)